MSGDDDVNKRLIQLLESANSKLSNITILLMLVVCSIAFHSCISSLHP